MHVPQVPGYPNKHANKGTCTCSITAVQFVLNLVCCVLCCTKFSTLNLVERDHEAVMHQMSCFFKRKQGLVLFTKLTP